MMNDKVAVVILNSNKKEYLIECLNSVLELNYSSFEVVVVDNGSIDGSPEIVLERFPDVHLLKLEKNLGVAKGRNAGYSFAKECFDFNYMLFLDNDTTLEPEFLNELVKNFSNKKDIGVICGKTFTEFSSSIIMSTGIITNLYTGEIYDRGSGETDEGQYNEICEVDACGGFGFMVSKNVFSVLKKIDERFSPYGWEDVDFCLKAKKSGYKILYVPTAVMYHKGTKQGRKPIPEYERNKAKNYILFLRLNTNLIQKITCCFFIPVRTAFLFLKLIKRGDVKMISHHFEGIYDAVKKVKLIK